MLRRLVLTMLLGGVAVLVVKSIPDIARYLRIRGM
jgi:hypothetical protein